ncbi:MAG: M20 family metallopeptidase [Myxococcales bacterium]|nr:M20 family metallopeptidase [Myxococcales bacterium]
MSIERFRAAAEAVDGLRGELDTLALDLHAHPELSYEERRSAEQVSAVLRRHGFSIESGIPDLPTAFRARRASRAAGSGAPEIVYMAEYDALPGVGHACGHNLIAGAGVGAGIALAEWLDAEGLPAVVTVLGTPAEERGGGKIELIRQGYFQEAACALMFHPYPKTVIAKQTLGVEEVVVEFHGRASHAAMAPEMGLNALDAMIQLFSGVGLLRQQLPGDVRVHGVITHGGEAPNVIPAYTRAWFFLRTLDPAYRATLRERFDEVAHGAARATGCSAKVHAPAAPYLPMRQNATMRGLVAEALDALGAEYELGPSAEEPVSTDAGNVSQELPTAHPFISIGAESIACHRSEFADAARSGEGLGGMMLAARALAIVGARVAAEPEVREDLWRDHRTPS